MTVDITKDMRFSPAFKYIDDGKEHGVLSPFAPQTMHLKKGEIIAEGFKPLECDIKMLKDVAVTLHYLCGYLPS